MRAHRVPIINNNGKPKPIVCKFVRRLPKDMVMSVRKDICRVNLAAAGLPEDSLLRAARIFNQLSPRMQTVLFETKNFKEQHHYSSYLSCRTQSTQIGYTVSNKQTTVWGVPQGSVLGALLFLIC